MLNNTDKHADYELYEDYWKRARDTYGGQKKVQAAGETYLPKLDNQSATQYESYKMRARFLNAVRRTVDGLTGMVFRKEPIVESNGIDGFLADVALQNQSFVDYAQQVINEVLLVAGGGTLVEHPIQAEVITVAQAEQMNMRPLFKFYAVENVINWRYKTINNIPTLVEVVLKEKYQNDSGEQKELTRNLLIDIDGVYKQIVTKPDDAVKPIEEIIPLMNGKTMEFIPFVFHNTRTGIKYEMPPLTDLVDTNIHHYQIEADHMHGLRYVALPTPYVTGCSGPEENANNEDGTPVKQMSLGPSEIWFIANELAKVGMLEFTGTGLAAIREQLSRVESHMAQLGARVLMPEELIGKETATKSIISAKSETSLLSRIVNVTSSQLTTALRYASMWMDKTDLEKYKVTLNTDFLPVSMTSADLTALVGSWVSGAISHETLFDNLKKGDIIAGDADFNSERKKIEDQMPPSSDLSFDDKTEESDNKDKKDNKGSK